MQSVSNATIRPGRSGSGSGTAPYPLPASPTLTNPDMILPDYDESPLSPDRSHSPLMAWKNAHAADIGFDLSPNAFTAGPIAPTTPIIYGNGTMLSDIGEVTEVESTCGPTRSRSGSTRSDFGTAPSSELPYEAIKQKIKQSRLTHQRHMSVESNSTVTANDRPALFADFDDTVSVDDSNFQGDDEDSVADSYIDDDSTQETVSKAKDSSLNADEARYSTPLSRRAEQILANAKRRLNVSGPVRTKVYLDVLSLGRRWKAILIERARLSIRQLCHHWALTQRPRHQLDDLPPPLALVAIKAIERLHLGTVGYLVRATFPRKTNPPYQHKGLLVLLVQLVDIAVLRRISALLIKLLGTSVSAQEVSRYMEPHLLLIVKYPCMAQSEFLSHWAKRMFRRNMGRLS